MEDDEFFLDDDELAKDNQLSILDLAKEKLLAAIEKSVKNAQTDLKFNERSEASSEVKMISEYTGLLVQLDSIDEKTTDKVEQQRLIDEILKQTTELTLGNIDDILKDEDELNGDPDGEGDILNADDSDDGSSLDF